MQVIIKEVENRKELKDFVMFQREIYKGNPYFVPPMINEEIETFTPSKNPGYKESKTKLFLAYNDNRIVGRIAAILNIPANKKYNTKNIRFGWVEFIDNYEVAEKLYKAVENWGRELGMETITGPHGFCDFDQQGMLIEGFDKLATIAGYYHLPYYHVHTEKFGFEKEIDYVEFLSTPPYKEGLPEKLTRTADWIKNRYNFKLLEYPKAKDYIKRGHEIMALLEETFEENYGTVPLNKEQIDYYIKKYISYIHKDLIKVVVTDDDTLIGFMITMPNLSKAYQKANGKLFPFGIYHLLKAFKTYDVLDFYLAGVKKEYRGKGVDVIMVVEIVRTAMKLGFKFAESNQELENNSKVQAEWKFFNPVQHKRRRIYKKSIQLSEKNK